MQVAHLVGKTAAVSSVACAKVVLAGWIVKTFVEGRVIAVFSA